MKYIPRFIVSNTKTFSDMAYQPGKLYRVSDGKWLCWINPSDDLFEPADGLISEGELVVYLGEEKGYLRLLVDNGAVVYVRTGTVENKSSIILKTISSTE
jgi:hypothetical protein